VSGYAAAVLTTLDHVLILVRDLESATGRFAELLDRSPSWRGAHPALGTANALFRLDNTYVELLCPSGSGAVAEMLAARLEERGEGLLGLAFGTDDAEACSAWLRERGLPAAAPADGEGRELTSGAVRRWKNVHLPPDATRGVLLFAIEHLSPADALPRAAIAGDPKGSVSGIDHVVVLSEDAEASRALYGDGLGLRLALDRRVPERSARLLFFRIGGITVEIGAALEPSRTPDAPDRLWGLAYAVADVERARERVGAAGFDVSEVRPGRKAGTRVCTVRGDPWGVATLLIGPD
jgi:catechol 2,3-dioxygenase-like lactoylglutathione lyase family enzyme